MRLLACILLLSSLLQHGVALPHTHEGSGMHDPAEHASHPHFHLSGNVHRVGHHAPSARWAYSTAAEHESEFEHAEDCDHDHDAVYVNASSTVNAVERSSVGLPQLQGIVAILDPLSDSRSNQHRVWTPGRYVDRVPLFLASTRLLV